ncbi:3672_t:CDS:2 [Acaulospora colombiana]|uniref:3672_t:CDS:1 n=1 Tax=Acaulospora colombiana TaxID=27376 RepID=A0ACA9KGV6_9GLOM|nr:3672_t:CDS:2 [Acaulospora colombiana]
MTFRLWSMGWTRRGNSLKRHSRRVSPFFSLAHKGSTGPNLQVQGVRHKTYFGRSHPQRLKMRSTDPKRSRGVMREAKPSSIVAVAAAFFVIAGSRIKIMLAPASDVFRCRCHGVSRCSVLPQTVQTFCRREVGGLDTRQTEKETVVNAVTSLTSTLSVRCILYRRFPCPPVTYLYPMDIVLGKSRTIGLQA